MLERFAEEAAHLSPLPRHPYDTARVLYRVCSIDGFVEYGGNRYAVPYDHVTDILPVRVTERELFVYAADFECVARHELLERGGHREIDPAGFHSRASRPAIDLDQLQETYQSMGEGAARFFDRLSQDEDYELFSTLPGAGPAFAPRLLAAFGEDRERFANAGDVQCTMAIAPVLKRSGGSTVVQMRYRCDRFLKQTFVEWAAQTIPKSFWARAFYDQQRAKGAKHQAALRALAFKWIRILFRVWKDRVPYDETRYLRDLKKRGSSLLKNIAQA